MRNQRESNLVGVLGSPFLSGLVVGRAISGVLLGDSFVERRADVGLREHLSDNCQNFRDFELRRPHTLENFLADFSSLLLDVGVVRLSRKLHRGVLKRVLWRHLQLQSEFSALVRRILLQFMYQSKRRVPRAHETTAM